MAFFFWPLFRKAQLCEVYGLKWSYGQILPSPLWSFAAPSGLSLVSFLPLWLMASLPGPWVLVGGPLLAGLLYAIFFHFFNNGFNGAPWDVQSFWYFFRTQPWSVLLHNFVPDLFWRAPWSSWCRLLGGVADSGAYQNRCIYTEIMWQIMWHLDCTQLDVI